MRPGIQLSKSLVLPEDSITQAIGILAKRHIEDEETPVEGSPR